MPKPTKKEILEQRRFLQRQKLNEIRFKGRFYKYLASVNNAIASELSKNGFGVNIDAFLKYESVEAIYRKLYLDITINEADIQWKELEQLEPTKSKKDLVDDLVNILLAPNESQPISLWKRLLNEFITVRVAGRITDVNTTTRKRIAYLIEKGLEDGLGAKEVATLIRKDQGYNRNRSLAIARTETITAGNQGKWLAAISSPYVMLKKWLPKVDARTRLSHADFIDRPWVEMEQLFFVANGDGVLEEARFPCDATLSASNVINCRCIVIFKIKTDDNGRPIRKNNFNFN